MIGTAKPQHPKARFYSRTGLFQNLTCFRELESRIATLSTEKERGDAFEVFAEAYFATQPVQKARNAWPFTAIPPSLRTLFGLHSKDVGVDGLIETFSGGYRAYQAKFRTNRKPLTWRETSTFFGLTDRCGERVLFTNSEDISNVTASRRDFSSIRGTDLDELEQRDFAAILAWLEGARVVRKKKTPRPHQAEALKKILPALRKMDRATVIMACGTGKTQLSLWAAEAVTSRKVLVLVPSLALLRQTLKEWVNETKWENYDYLCVCSDPTVSRGEDELVIRPTELEFSVSTESSQVRRFLNRPFNGIKIVFSTYQSAEVVAQGMKRGEAFDIGVFDEAHKTAGREGAKFTFALKDQNLPIRKRLFLTATPRHYNIHQRDDEGEPVEVFSMNRPEIYGPVVHTLTFAKAAKHGIICRYKVVISIVTSRMVDQHRLRHGKVLVRGEEITASQVANQLALAQAVQRHRLRKVFTFHRSVSSAQSFTGGGGEGIHNHLKGFAAFHVNGTMPTADRDGIMNEFRAAPRAVMSNARCLTEGIDVPAVDMVAFLTPKRSKVDIVQATGRAMRIDPANRTKTTGYILVPLYVEQARGETIDEAIDRAEFDEVWAVLQAMQEQDQVLDDTIHFILAGGRKIKGFDESRIRERVEVIGPRISIKTLRKAIATRCLKRLERPWNTMVQRLLLFKRRFGHLRVPWDVPQPWKQLAVWVDRVRALKRTGQLSMDREFELDALGFEWRVDGQTLDDTIGLLNEREFGKIAGLANMVRYRKLGLIKPCGRAVPKGGGGGGLSYFYHPRQITELKKRLGITLDNTRGLLNEQQFIKLSGFTKVAGYRKRGLIKPVGKSVTNAGISFFYHPRQIKQLRKALGITLDNTRGLLNETEFRKASGLTRVEKYRQEGLVKPVGRAIAQSGLCHFYHPRQVKELRNRLGITLNSTSGLLNETQFMEAVRLTNVKRYRREGLIKPVGKAISNAGLSYFYHPRQGKELKWKLGVTLDDTSNLLNEEQFKRVSGLAGISVYRKRGLIQPVGRAISNSGLCFFYHPRQIKELKKKLDITLDRTTGLLNESQIRRMFDLSMARYRKQGLIQPVGRAMSASKVSYFYHPKQIKTLKRRLVRLKKAQGSRVRRR